MQDAGCGEKYLTTIRGVESVQEVLVTAEPQVGRSSKRRKMEKGYAEETEIGNSGAIILESPYKNMSGSYASGRKEMGKELPIA